MQLDDVHGGHREAGAVDHAANGAVEADIIEVDLGGSDLYARGVWSGMCGAIYVCVENGGSCG
eukprot:356376-Chlamydomonas_euryale.AAC.5